MSLFNAASIVLGFILIGWCVFNWIGWIMQGAASIVSGHEYNLKGIHSLIVSMVSGVGFVFIVFGVKGL